MRQIPLLITSAVVVCLGLAAEAGNHKPLKGHPVGVGRVADCPPGLAKKNPPCLPPGLARKYGRGDIIFGDYRIVRHPGRYGLDANETYYRVDDYVYRVDRDTREVLDLIGAAVRVLN